MDARQAAGTQPGQASHSVMCAVCDRRTADISDGDGEEDLLLRLRPQNAEGTEQESENKSH